MQSSFLVLMHVLAVLCLPSPKVVDDEDIDDDIPNINQELNLYEGDIAISNARSTLLNESARWNIQVPYVLDESLDLKAAAVILQAFEQFALKSCISFAPWRNEDYFLSIEKRTGCWSYVGKTFARGQTVSIGRGCATIEIVEHELLHALGFFHEQSRYDRDDYVTIVYENIQEGRQGNFKKASNKTTSLLNTTYDYTSIMHYRGSAFTNGNGSTIITKQPEFQDVIGRSKEMSSTDALELNRLYKCNSSAAFLGNCSFEDEDMCGMSTCSRGPVGWERVDHAKGGPNMDHTHLSTNIEGEGFFMHFSAIFANEGDSGRLSTKMMTPSRACPVQCVQFYYYHSGNEMDVLNVWIREFDGYWDTHGHRRLMGQIKGSPADYWKIHHVPLNATKRFQVEFEAIKGEGSSYGGFSLDDINLSETECPHQTWQIRNFGAVLNTSSSGTYLYSPRFHTMDGYSYQILLARSQIYFSLYLRLVSGDYDDQLEWPLAWRFFTAKMMDQNPQMQERINRQYNLVIDPGVMIDDERYLWGNPSESGSPVEIDGESYNASYKVGKFNFMKLGELQARDYLKGGDGIFLFSWQDIRPLFTNNSLPCAKIPQQDFTSFPDENADDGPCFGVASTTTPTTKTTTTIPTSTTTTTTVTTPTTTPTSTTTTTTVTTPTTTTTMSTTTTTTTTTTTQSTTTAETEDPDVDGSCNSILCSFSPKMDVSLLLLLIPLLLLFNR